MTLQFQILNNAASADDAVQSIQATIEDAVNQKGNAVRLSDTRVGSTREAAQTAARRALLKALL